MAGLGLTTAVRGFFEGQDQQRREKIENEDRAWQQKQRGRQEAQWARDDKKLAGQDAATAAFKAAYEGGDEPAGLVTGQPAAQPPAGAGPGIVPGAAGPAAGAAQPGLVTAPGAARSPADEPLRVMRGLKAAASAYAKHGDPEAWAKTWAQAADVRGKLRAQTIDQVEGAIRSGASPALILEKVYPLVDDGMDLVPGSIKEVGKDAKGDTVFGYVAKNEQTGQETEVQITGQQLLGKLAWARDPAAVRKAEAELAMERFKTNEQIRQEQGKQKAIGEREEKVEGIKTKNKREEQENAGRIESGHIAQRGKVQKDVDDNRESNERGRPKVVGDGGIVVAPVSDGKGGVGLKPIFENKKDPRTNPAAAEAKATTINAVRSLYTDPVQGRRADESTIVNIARGAEEAMADDPSLSMSAAIAKAQAVLAATTPKKK